MTVSSSVAPYRGASSSRRSVSMPGGVHRAAPVGSAPARLTRPPRAVARPERFISIAQYVAGYANRDQWPILWPHLHSPWSQTVARPAQRRPHPVPAPLIRPQERLPTPVAAPAQSEPALPSPDAGPHPPATLPGASLGAHRRVRRYTRPSISVPTPAPPLQPPTSPLTLTPTQPPIPPQPQPQPQPQPPQAPVSPAAPTLSAWQRVCDNKGVQRALAIGKLAADGLDLLGAVIVAPITGSAIYSVVLKNLKADVQQLLSGKPAQAGSAGGAAAAGVPQWVRDLGDARDRLKGAKPFADLKLKALRRAVWGRGLTFAASLFMIGASGAVIAANPAIGGVMTALSVYAARQAYANWRLARENLNNQHADRATSPMGSSALGHVLNQAYLQEREEGVSPTEIQAQAARSAVMVGVASVVVSAAVGGVAMTAGAALPALWSSMRHGVRAVGSVAAPVSEVVDSYVTEERVADLAQAHRFDQTCTPHWETFFREQPAQVAVYKSALVGYVNHQQGPLPRPRPCAVVVGSETMDIGPLIRWTRDTRRFSDLQAWLALDGQMTGGLNWAQRVFKDLEVIDGTRAKMRLTSVLSAAASATPSSAFQFQ